MTWVSGALIQSSVNRALLAGGSLLFGSRNDYTAPAASGGVSIAGTATAARLHIWVKATGGVALSGAATDSAVLHEPVLAMVDVGTSADDGTGDYLRDAFVKLNTNSQAIEDRLFDFKDEHFVLAAPVGEAEGRADFRALIAADIPDLSSAYVSATASRSANTVFAGPNGGSGAATFRALAAADLPNAVSFQTVTASGSTALTTAGVYLFDATNGAQTAALPAAASNSGRVYTVKKIDSSANAVTLDGNSSETIDGETTAALPYQHDALTVLCDGSTWHIL